MKLTLDEKKYLFSKLEYKKKKVAIEKENEVFQLLKGDKTNFSNEDVDKIVKSLEFTFRKRLIGDKPDLKNDIFLSIKSKLPKDIIIVKQGRIDTKPTKTSTKPEIITFLKRKKINFDEKSTKTQLLGLFENKHIKTFEDFKLFETANRYNIVSVENTFGGDQTKNDTEEIYVIERKIDNKYCDIDHYTAPIEKKFKLIFQESFLTAKKFSRTEANEFLKTYSLNEEEFELCKFEVHLRPVSWF